MTENIDLRDLKGEDLKVWKKAVKEQIDWTPFKKLAENEPYMIHENNWKDHAWDCAGSCFDIDLDKGSLACYFNLDKWADELKMDYTEIEVEGQTYYFRSW